MGIRAPQHTVRRAVALLLLAMQAACYTPPRLVSAPTPFLRSENPKRIWVSLSNGEQLIINAPKVYGDTLLGIARKGQTQEEVWLALADLREVKTRRVSGMRTALLGGAIAASVALGIILIPAAGGERTPLCNYDCDEGQ